MPSRPHDDDDRDYGRSRQNDGDHSDSRRAIEDVDRPVGRLEIEYGERGSSKLQLQVRDRGSSRQVDDRNRGSSRQIENRDRGNSRPLENGPEGGRSGSKALTKANDPHPGSRASAKGNYGRDEYVRQGPDDVVDTSRNSRSVSGHRDDAFNMIGLNSALPSRQGDSRMPSRSGDSRMPSRSGDSRVPTRSGPTRRLGGIAEDEEVDYGGTGGDQRGQTQAMTRRDRDATMTRYGGGTSYGGNRGMSSVVDIYNKHDSDSDQEVITKKRYSPMSGQLFKNRFPDLRVSLENELKIKPEKLDDYCEAGYIRLDQTKNRADIDKLLKNATPNDRERCMKGIKRYDNDQENERHLKGGKRARSILEPVGDDHESSRGGRSGHDSGSTRDALSVRENNYTRDSTSTRLDTYSEEEPNKLEVTRPPQEDNLARRGESNNGSSTTNDNTSNTTNTTNNTTTHHVVTHHVPAVRWVHDDPRYYGRRRRVYYCGPLCDGYCEPFTHCY